MNTLGIDHGTQNIRFCLLKGDKKELFKIGREEILKKNVLEEIEKRIALEDISLVGLTYSMGDGIDKITDIKLVKNRGVIETITGMYIGGGTKVYDDIESSNLKAVVIPGLHRGVNALDRRFRALYSHCASAEKVSLSYHAFLKVNEKMKADNMIISDISSNTVTIGIKDCRFFGAVDACLGALGLFHGPLDLEAIRRVDRKEISANRAFYSSGAVKIFRTDDVNKILDSKDGKARLALESLILSAKMEMFSFLSEIKPQAFVITGSAGVSSNVFRELDITLKKIAPVFGINDYAASIGSAEIARDILCGRKDFLGMGVDFKG